MKPTVVIPAIALFVAGYGLGTSQARGVMLAKDGKPQAVIVLPADADKNEQLAGEELVTYIEKISGAKLAVLVEGTDKPEKGTARILLGQAAKGLISKRDLDQALGNRRDELSCRDGFVIKTVGNKVRKCTFLK